MENFNFFIFTFDALLSLSLLLWVEKFVKLILKFAHSESDNVDMKNSCWNPFIAQADDNFVGSKSVRAQDFYSQAKAAAVNRHHIQLLPHMASLSPAPYHHLSAPDATVWHPNNLFNRQHAEQR